MKRELVLEGLTGVIRHTAFEVHSYFGYGFLEKVYENALANRLRQKGFVVGQQVSMVVRDEDGTVVGDYVADLFVNGQVIIEVKAAATIANEHVAQLLNYLKTTGAGVGLLLNFGAKKLQVRRLVMTPVGLGVFGVFGG